MRKYPMRGMKHLLALAAAFILAASPLMAQVIAGGGGSGGGGSSATFVSTNIQQLNGNPLAIGQSLMASAIPVVLASDQTPVQPVVYTGVTMTRPATTPTFAAGQILYSTATGSQAATTTIQAARQAGQSSTITGFRLKKSSTTTTNAVFRVYLFNAQPTLVSTDTGPLVSSLSTGYVACFDVTTTDVFSDGVIGRGNLCGGGANLNTSVTSSQNYLYYVITAQQAYVGVSGEVFTPIVEVQ